MTDPGTFAAVAVALYAGHHVGDYWFQTDGQAAHKGDHGSVGRWACIAHVTTYLLAQSLTLVLINAFLNLRLSVSGVVAALIISGVTHYLADRREYGIMFWLARKVGKSQFMKLGIPRATVPTPDNPCLGTGRWALDQSWHIFWGVFVSALVAVVL